MAVATMTMISMGAGAFAGLLSLGAALWLSKGRADPPRPVLVGSLAEPRRFLFRNGYLVEHSGNVGFLLPEPIDHLRAWDALTDAVGTLVDGATDAFEALRETGRPFQLEGRLGRDCLNVTGRREGDALRISVAPAEAVRGDGARRESLHMLETEVALLTGIADSSPAASWVLDDGGRVIWANAAYQVLAERTAGPDSARGWPLVDLFPADAQDRPGRARRALSAGDGTELWFEVLPGMPDSAGHRRMHAVPLEAVVAVEESLRGFRQTLTKTFAHLPTGLAIFDRERGLAMFNPRLMEMTGLDGLWLSRRPRIEEFFDALRERRKLPEPRDYKAWRDKISDLSRPGTHGTYEETWTLPTGETYRVTGRPQGDGAVTLMLEDVSDSISANRAQRRERDLLEAALDATDAAVVVFGADGARLAANGAARAALAAAHGTALPDTLDEALSTWRTRFKPSSAWGDLRAVARGAVPGDMAGGWSAVLEREGATDVPLRVLPARGGGVTLSFGFPRADTLRAVSSDLRVAIAAE